MADDKYKEFVVDLWVTDFNPTEIGIYQHSRHQAKSRQFTKDMDIFGEVKENGERKSLLAVRKGLWKNEKGMSKRLVIKLFSASINWKGTMDLLLGRSMQLSHGAGSFPVVAFNINLANQEHVVQVERSAHQWVGTPEKFSFFVLRNGHPHFYKIRRKYIGIGVDYFLYDQNNKRIGKLDGKVIQLGGKWKVRLLKEHADAQMCAVLQLFCGMLKFNDDCRMHVKSLVGDMHRGKVDPSLETQEADMYLNPRRAR